MGAKVVSPQEAPEFHASIERLCIQANLPEAAGGDRRHVDAERVRGRPLAEDRHRVRDDRNPRSCSTPAELEGVLAHELTHVQNRDVMVMTIASFFASIASFIVQMGFWFGGWGGGDDDDNGVELDRRDPRVRGRLHGLVRAAPGAVALPRVRRRPRLGDHHRPPERAHLGADEDQRQYAADSAARPARRERRAGRVLHLPAEGQADASRTCSRRIRRSRRGSRRCSGSRHSSRVRPSRSETSAAVRQRRPATRYATIRWAWGSSM